MQNKAQLRRHLRTLRLRLPQTTRQRAEAAVRRQLKPWLRRQQKVGIYLAVGSELNITAIVQDALKHGCQLYAPYIEPRQRRLWFTPYPPTSARSHTVFNITQYHGKKCRVEHLDVVLMPLIGVDKRGMRLGQGGGFYDTSLAYARPHRPLRIGIGFACQLCDAIPSETHDQPLDAFISEQGIHYFGRLQPRF